jgi:hypothetical protein
MPQDNQRKLEMRIIMMVAIFSILTACSEHELASSPAVAPIQSMVVAASSVAATTPRELSEFEKHETDEIANSEGLVSRVGKTLSLHLLSGKVLALNNLETCEAYEDCLFYTYRGLVADKQFFLVDVSFYEGGETLLISRKNGEDVDTVETPHLSPDGRFIISASDHEAYSDPGVFLWEVVDGVLVSRFNFVPSEYELFKFIRWIDSDKVELIKTSHPLEGLCPENTQVEYQVQLVKNTDGWAMETMSDKGKCLSN